MTIDKYNDLNWIVNMQNSKILLKVTNKHMYKVQHINIIGYNIQ